MANTVDTYTALIPSANADKPKFTAMVSAVSQCFVDAQSLLASLPSSFDLDVAAGSQLDVDALWIGASRFVSVPITDVYFTFDDTTNLVGFDQGIWFFPNNPTTGVQSLDDETFRLLCRFKIAANSWDGTTSSMYTILTELFSPAVVTISADSFMECDITITGTPPSTLFKLLATEGYLPMKPAGVTVNYTFA